MTTAVPPKAGLEDVVAASSAICYLDGERGVLAYRGYDIHDLATQATFEEVCYLLWHGRSPPVPSSADSSPSWRRPGSCRKASSA
jgi:citrate synthase